MRGGTRVVRGGRPGFVDGTGGLGETDFGGGFETMGFDKRGFGETGFGNGEVLPMDERVSPGVNFPGDVLLVRIFANFSANSVVRPS